MPLAKPVLGAMKKLGATLPDDAPSLATADLLAQVRWPSGELESRPGSKHWFEPLRLNFSIPRLYKDDPVGGGEEGPHLYVGGTDHQFLLLRERDRDEVDPEILVFDPEESGALAIRFSELLKLLRVKKPTPAAHKKLIEGIEKPSIQIVNEAIREGADVNKPVRRDVIAPPLLLALRGLHKPEASEVIVALLQAGADPNHEQVHGQLLGGGSGGTDAFHAAFTALVAHGIRLPKEHASATSPVLFDQPRTLALMIAHGLDPNATAMNAYVKPMIKLSSLCNAAWRGGFERSEVLVQLGADVNYLAEPYGLTPLHFAVASPDAERLVPLLLAHGARDRRSEELGEGLLRYDTKPVRIAAPGLTARQLAEQLGRSDIAALIPV